MKTITLAFPIFSLTEIEKNNILHLIENKNDLSEIYLISDNPSINMYLHNFFDGLDCVIIDSKENLGKYQVVKNASINFNSIFTKICDPDDLILIEELNHFSIEFQKYSSATIIPFIRFRPTLNVQSGEWKSDFLNKNKDLIRQRSFLSVVNENSVIPTKDIVEFELNVKNQTKSSDVLFSLSHFHKEEINVIDYDKSFYVYNFRKGLTSSIKINTSKNMLEQLIVFLKIMTEYNDKNKMWAPSFFDYKWAHNFLANSNFDELYINEKINEIFDLLKVCAKSNESWKIEWNETERKELLDKLNKKELFEL